MMKWKSVLFLMVATLPLSATPRAISEGELKEKLRFYRNIHTLTASFTQKKHLKKLALQLESSGSFELIRPEKVIWTVLKPAKIRLTMDREQIDMETGEGDSKKIQHLNLSGPMDPTTSKGILSMMAWLQIDTTKIAKEYSLFETSKSQFECVPREKEHRMFEKMTVFLHEKGHVARLVLDEISGDQIDIAFKNPTVTFFP